MKKNSVELIVGLERCSGLFVYCCGAHWIDDNTKSYCCVNNALYNLFWVAVGLLTVLLILLVVCSSNCIRERKKSKFVGFYGSWNLVAES